MEDFDPFDLDVSVLRERLKSNISIKGQQAGRQHRRALPIDLFVTELSERRRAPMLRGASELSLYDKSGCAYKLARDGTYHAAVYALFRTGSNEQWMDATAALKKFSNQANNVQNQLNELAANLSTILRAQEHAFDDEIDRLSLLREINALLFATFALKRLEAPTTRLYRQRSQNPGNVWRGAFVTSMFGSWWKLTGSDPSTTGPFEEFVQAAWSSLKPKMPEVSWESAIRTARVNIAKEHGSSTPWRGDPRLTALTCD